MQPVKRQWFVVDWERCLGAGGEGEVFLGRCLTTWELCAVKVSTALDGRQARQQLSQELQRCLRAASQHVVGLIAYNLEAPRPFLVFEFARAGTLADEMRAIREQGSVYHPTQALQRIREVLLSLASVHASGQVHRDVKPANLLRFSHTTKLTDFGTGRTLHRPSSVNTEVGIGTRLYAAPEQVRCEAVDERADLYAVGCVLHEMLTGVVPGPCGTSRMTGRYPGTLVLPQLDRLVLDLLAEQKSKRPVNASDAIKRVDAILAEYQSARSVWEKLGLGPSPY